MTLFQLSYALLWVLAIALVPISVVLLYLMAQLQQQIGSESPGLGNNLIGRKLPIASAKDGVSGVARTINEFSNQIHVILLFSPHCGSCRHLLDALGSLSDKELADIRLLLLCMDGNFDRCKAEASHIRSLPVLVQDVKDESTIDLWRAGFPAALVVDDAGVVVDVRHPLSIRGLVTVVKNATMTIHNEPTTEPWVVGP